MTMTNSTTDQKIFSDTEMKIWGTVRHQQHGPIRSSLLQVRANTYCSIHRHMRHWNHFLVVEGAIDIVLYHTSPLGMLAVNKRISLTGHPATDPVGFSVPPTVWHRFEVIRSGHIIEGYWTSDGSPANLADIERMQEGGVL